MGGLKGEEVDTATLRTPLRKIVQELAKRQSGSETLLKKVLRLIQSKY